MIIKYFHICDVISDIFSENMNVLRIDDVSGEKMEDLNELLISGGDNTTVYEVVFAIDIEIVDEGYSH